VTGDHYATLGVTPSSEQVVIHAAYRALMRRYHPDTNAGSEAGERVRAITAAYHVLRDPDRRAEYDSIRAAGDPLQALQMGEGAWTEPERPPAGRAIGVAAIAIAALAVAAVWIMPRGEQGVAPAPRSAGQAEAAPTPYAAPDPAMQLASARPPALPLPEPAEPVADPQLDRVADPPARAPSAAPQTAVAAAVPKAPAVPPTAPVVRRPAAAASPERCRGMECSSERIAALDQHSELMFNQSMNSVDPARRERLRATRDELLVRRGACRSEACVAGAYLAYLKEVGAIVDKSAPAPR